MSRLVCESIPGPTLEEVKRQLAMAKGDMVELRLDLFSKRDIPSLQKLKKSSSLPMIFTLRSKEQGGGYLQSEEERLEELFTLVEGCLPEYLDLESHVPEYIVHAFASRFPDMKILISFHDFTSTPEDLDRILASIQRTGATLYKIAVTATNSSEAVRFLAWAKKVPVPLIAISMGPFGQISRIIAQPITYACLEEEKKTAPGQLTVQELANYSGNRLFGLIGDPVSRSISHITHNRIMQQYGLDALYVKMQVVKEELAPFLYWAKALGFRGLSVTMPLKEAILPYLDFIDPEAAAIGAVNTLCIEQGKISGYNTDGKGALNAIDVDNKRVLILGAGGAARAIGYEAKKKNAHVTFAGRDLAKVEAVAHMFSCSSVLMERISCVEYDVLINCTPLALPCHQDLILPGATVMDINTIPKTSPFLAHAKQRGCQIVYGWQMFVEQAALQFELWFPDRF